MMSSKAANRQAGFGHLGPIIALVLVLAIVGIIGYKLYGSTNKSSDTAQATTPTATTTPAADLTDKDAPAVNSSSDLDKASAVLDQVGADSQSSADTSQLNAQLSGL